MANGDKLTAGDSNSREAAPPADDAAVAAGRSADLNLDPKASRGLVADQRGEGMDTSQGAIASKLKLLGEQGGVKDTVGSGVSTVESQQIAHSQVRLDGLLKSFPKPGLGQTLYVMDWISDLAKTSDREGVNFNQADALKAADQLEAYAKSRNWNTDEKFDPKVGSRSSVDYAKVAVISAMRDLRNFGELRPALQTAGKEYRGAIESENIREDIKAIVATRREVEQKAVTAIEERFIDKDKLGVVDDKEKSLVKASYVEDQQKIDEMVKNLPEALKSGETATVKWIENFSGMKVEDATSIIEQFKKAGYSIDAELGNPKIAVDPSVSARYVIGQAMSSLQRQSEIHPLIGRYAGDHAELLKIRSQHIPVDGFAQDQGKLADMLVEANPSWMRPESFFDTFGKDPSFKLMDRFVTADLLNDWKKEGQIPKPVVEDMARLSGHMMERAADSVFPQTAKQRVELAERLRMAHDELSNPDPEVRKRAHADLLDRLLEQGERVHSKAMREYRTELQSELLAKGARNLVGATGVGILSLIAYKLAVGENKSAPKDLEVPKIRAK